MKLHRTLPAAPTLISAFSVLALVILSSGCSVTPPSAVNAPTVTQATQPTSVASATPTAPAEATSEATSETMPLPTLPAGRTPRQLETPITIEMTTTRQPVSTGQPPVLVFQWRGGFMGRNDLWTIYAGGLIRNNKDQQFEVPPETVTNLMQQLEKLGFYDLQDRYEASCNDCFEYTIYAYKDGQRKAVFAIDNGELPETLMQAVKAIQDVVAPTT